MALTRENRDTFYKENNVHDFNADAIDDFGVATPLAVLDPRIADLLNQWLSPVAELAIDNERLVMAIASLLTAHGIGHRGVMGSVSIAGVGTAPRHHWIELDGGVCLDFRARTWLDDSTDPRVPYGAFLPAEGNFHDAHRFVNGHYSPTVFFTLTGASMRDFPIPENLGFLLKNMA